MENTTNSGDKTWDNIKEGYLYQVEKSLMRVKHPAKKQVLEDVSSHLDQKYAELNGDNKVWESYQQIITDMGPAEDYAELLDGERPMASSKNRSWLFYFLIFDFIAVALVFVFVVMPNFSGKSDKPAYIETATYIVSFEGKGDFRPTTAKELLDGFNGEIDFRVKTHHFRTEAIGKKLIGRICTDTEYNKNSILKHLHDSKIIKIFDIEAIDEDEFEKYKQLGQPGLEAIYIISFGPVEGFAPITAKELLNAFNNRHSDGAKTSYFRTKVEDGRLTGHICVNSKKDKGSLTRRLRENEKLEFIGSTFNPISKEAFERHKALGQPGLPRAIDANTTTEKGMQSTYEWLSLIDNGEYGRSWDETASFFKKHVTRTQWEEALEGIFKPLGKVISREVISQTAAKAVPGGPDGEYVIIQFRTEYENKKAVETVTPMLEDGKWRISGYYIK